MFKWYKADLHIHTVLSPCGGLEMSPSMIFGNAENMGIDMVAITDHNSMKNSVAYEKAAQGYNLTYLYGVEIQTAEEIHLIAIFDNKTDAMSFDKKLYASLLPIKNNPDFFGDQVIIDENENILGFEEIALINSSIWSFDEAIDEVKNSGGFAFPAHVDATSFSVIAQLGFVPENPNIFALGITKKCKLDEFLQKYPLLKSYSFIKNSDAHYPNEVGTGYTEFYIKKPCFDEIIYALQKKDGRKTRVV